MSTYTALKNEILNINRELANIFPRANTVVGPDGNSFAAWEKTCVTVRDQIAAEILRVAIIGSIKSGKSTFANAFFRGDYLKRGAGVVTSIVTKVRRGQDLKATLFLKSWDEVNAEIQQALVLFPTYTHDMEIDAFDIRRKEDRARLEEALSGMGSDLLIENGSLNANTVLLSSYVKGFEHVKDALSAENRTLRYEGDAFKDYTVFVGNDAMAVYLQDMQLEINSGGIVDNLEIADCQGSDSPNPLHLAMIQDYLLLTHLIIYVVSSRTGLRQADIKFLSMIKKMGIIDNILFVVNTDFSEHESIDALTSLMERVREELAMLHPNPDLFTFSALYNLFRAVPETLSTKDSQRLSQWHSEKAFTDFSNRETERFEAAFGNILKGERPHLLLGNHLERLAVVSSGVDQWIDLNRNLLSSDMQGASKIMEKVKYHQSQVNQVASVINSTLTGAVIEVKQRLRTDIDRFFSSRSGDVVEDTIEFVKKFKVPYDQYEEALDASGFSNTLYLIFQGFRQALDAFMAESVNPVIIRFVRDEEQKIIGTLRSAVDPYHEMVRSSLSGYEGLMENSGDTPRGDDKAASGGEVLDVDAIKRVVGLTLPPVATAVRFSARIKADAVLRLGLYTIVSAMKKIFKKAIKDHRSDEILALKEGVKRIKRETEKAILYHYKNYRENLKFQYMFVLADALSRTMNEGLISRFGIYETDLTHLSGLLDKQGNDKESALEILDEMSQINRELEERIVQARHRIKENTLSDAKRNGGGK